MNLKRILPKFLLLSFILCLGQHSFAQVTEATMKQINLLLQEKNSRTPAQKKIDSRLLQAVRENRGESMAAGVSTLERADVKADASGTLKVDIDGDITPAFLSKIQALGATVIHAAPEYHTVRATIKLAAVESISKMPELKFIQPAVGSMVVDAGRNKTKATVSYAERVANVKAKITQYLNAQGLAIGSVTSQGDAAHRATDVRSTYGYLGAGIKIGVLSDSYNAKGNAASDVTKGDLPGTGNPDGYTTPVTVVEDYSGGDDEGRAMLQVIHDLAPAATLYFATADVSEADFASNITKLRTTYGCNIVLDDVGYFDEPAFQDGIAAAAVNTVTASGGLYFSSAGNSGALAKGTSGVFEGDFNDAGSVTFAGSTKAGTVHNFGTVSSPVNGDIITAAGEVYNLNWSDAWGASSNDYDLFLVSSSGTVKGSSTNAQTGTQNPYEQVTAARLVSGDRLVVFKATGAAVRALHLNTNRGTLTVATNGQTTGHACAADAYCMAATPAATAFESGYPTGPYPGAFVSTNKVEPFSSDGPRKMFYNSDGSAITAGNFLFGTSGGTTRSKPDLTAADGVSTTFASSTGLSPFFGTSCAAPHAGAIAALILSANPALTPAQVRTILTSTALDIEGTGYDINTGYGIIQAFQAAQAVAVMPCSIPGTLSSTSVTTTTATVKWAVVSGANSYDVDYKKDTASTWTNAVTATTADTFNLSSLVAGTLYDWRVRSDCGSAASAYDTANFTTVALPSCGIPSSLTSTNITSSTATISWAAVNGANNYTAGYKLHSSSSWINVVNEIKVLKANLTGLKAGSLYDWRVRSNCPSGSSIFSIAQFTTLAVPKCNGIYDTAVHNTFMTSVAIPLNTDVYGTIRSKTNTDNYNFKITNKGTISIHLTNLPADYDLALYNSSKTLLQSSKTRGTGDETINRSVIAGTFYVTVVGYEQVFDSVNCYTLNVTTGTASKSDDAMIADNATSDKLLLFPNPAHDMLNLQGAKIQSGAMISIVDVYGKSVIKQQSASLVSQVNINKLTPGIYLLKVINKDGTVAYTSKFVKQ